MRNAYKILVGEPEEKRPLVRHRRRLEDNIRTDLMETWWKGVDCIHPAQNMDQGRALVNKLLRKDSAPLSCCYCYYYCCCCCCYYYYYYYYYYFF
jgi:hypothetical protein